jgi:hypothetical protein
MPNSGALCCGAYDSSWPILLQKSAKGGLARLFLPATGPHGSYLGDELPNFVAW